jgi:hypothetical protein
MSCPNCPCRENCLGWRIFCAWAAEDPPDPVKIRHIRARSAMGPSPPATQVDRSALPQPVAFDSSKLPPLGGCCG